MICSVLAVLFVSLFPLVTSNITFTCEGPNDLATEWPPRNVLINFGNTIDGKYFVQINTIFNSRVFFQNILSFTEERYCNFLIHTRQLLPHNSITISLFIQET